jgi:hypothetical protein
MKNSCFPSACNEKHFFTNEDNEKRQKNIEKAGLLRKGVNYGSIATDDRDSFITVFKFKF